MNTVVVENWYAQPIHCPFCGHAQIPNEKNCKHLLYVIVDGNFAERSPRFDALLGGEASECHPEFSINDRAKFGKPRDVADQVRDKLPTSIEFLIMDPGGGSEVGFAALDEELCGWGRDHQSPYLEEK